jgi:hypothetical protein
MAAAGILHERIAEAVGIAENTLRLHFSRELRNGIDRVTELAVGTLVQQMKVGNIGAACFWLKCRAGWRETDRLEHVGEGGGPVILKVEYEDKSVPE